MRKNILLIDTETCSLQGPVYDIGYVITDKLGRIKQERSWLVREIFTNAKQMMGSFYAGKTFSHYAPMLDNNEIKLTNWDDIVEIIKSDIIEYEVNILSAYNLSFDIRVMFNTSKQIGDGSNIFGDLDALCIWQFAKQTKLKQKNYAKVVEQENWFTPTGLLSTTAENAYRYIMGDFKFVEDHTALSDALIENEILRSCFASKKKIPYNVIPDKYRSAA